MDESSRFRLRIWHSNRVGASQPSWAASTRDLSIARLANTTAVGGNQPFPESKPERLCPSESVTAPRTIHKKPHVIDNLRTKRLSMPGPIAEAQPSNARGGLDAQRVRLERQAREAKCAGRVNLGLSPRAVARATNRVTRMFGPAAPVPRAPGGLYDDLRRRASDISTPQHVFNRLCTGAAPHAGATIDEVAQSASAAWECTAPPSRCGKDFDGGQGWPVRTGPRSLGMGPTTGFSESLRETDPPSPLG